MLKVFFSLVPSEGQNSFLCCKHNYVTRDITETGIFLMKLDVCIKLLSTFLTLTKINKNKLIQLDPNKIRKTKTTIEKQQQ